MTEETVTYNLTFTAGSAMLNETHAVAEAFLQCEGDWNKTKELTFRENLMEKNRLSTNQRVFALMRQRISALNGEELTLLVDGNMAARRQMVLLAICKAHPLSLILSVRTYEKVSIPCTRRFLIPTSMNSSTRRSTSTQSSNRLPTSLSPRYDR